MQAMQCPDCGNDVGTHQRFCDECGGDLHPPTAIDETLATQPVTALPAPTVDDPTVPNPAVQDPTVQDPTEPIQTVQEPTEPIHTLPPPHAPLVITSVEDVEAARATGVATTAEMPALFDGLDDLAEYPAPREAFRLRISFVLGLFAAIASIMLLVADVIDIRTTRPASGIATGVRTLDDLGTNLGLAGFIGAAVAVIGGVLACFGLRWGAGLAGGAGLALAGWSALVIGLAEHPIAVAESITRTSSESFTLRVTRDLGWWLAAGIGIVGILIFLSTLRSIGSGRRPPLNPIIAAVTAVATAVLACGPLVPVGTASFADNFRSTDPDADLPAALFAGRLGQVGLIALAGVVGMLIVRAYGLGLAAGGVSVAAWLWISSLLEVGDLPIGIADRNPGASSTVPHAVTTVGMVASLAFLAIAAMMATIRLRRAAAPRV